MYRNQSFIGAVGSVWMLGLAAARRRRGLPRPAVRVSNQATDLRAGSPATPRTTTVVS